jgi:arylformamidase
MAGETTRAFVRGGRRYVELSHVLEPSGTARKLSFRRIGADEVNPNVVRKPGEWYIMHELTLVNHIGTHIEAPYHLYESGADVADLAPQRLAGQGICLRFEGLAAGHLITIDEIRGEAADVREGDLVFCRYGVDHLYGTERYGDAPRFEPRALRWLADRGIALLGVEASGVELAMNPEHVNHRILLDRGIPLVENVANLGLLTQRRFEAIVLPIRIRGLDSIPVQIVAIEEA